MGLLGGSGGLRVLNAGGGAGRVVLLLADDGNRVVLADPSREMLCRAERAFARSRHAAAGQPMSRHAART